MGGELEKSGSTDHLNFSPDAVSKHKETGGSLANPDKPDLWKRWVLPQPWVSLVIRGIKVKCLSRSLGLTSVLLVKYTELDGFFFKRCEIFQMGIKRPGFVVVRSYKEGKKCHFLTHVFT